MPRIWTPPLRDLEDPANTLGYEVIDFSNRVLEIDLLPWQQWLFVHGLELKSDGNFRFRKVLVLVPRQCGKTTALMVLSLWRMAVDGAKTILGTSTNLDYAKEAWTKAVELAWGPPDSKYFQGVSQFEGVFTKPRLSNGELTLSTVDGARYKIGTASRTGGRSLSVDLVIMDELREHKTFAAWAAASKTTNARPRGQTWALSNMGDDTSVVLNHFQEQARGRIESGGGGDPSLALFEWSAPEGCAVDDREAWQVAIPALGYTVDEDTIASDAANDPEEVFRTEVLCQRVATLEPLPITVGMWRRRIDEESAISDGGRVVLSAEVAVDRLRSSVGVAGWRDDGNVHVGLINWESGSDWLFDRLVELAEAHDLHRVNRGSRKKPEWHPAVIIDPMSPTNDLVEPLRRYRSAKFPRGIDPVLMTAREVATATGGMQDALTDGTAFHRDQPAVDTAISGAVKRDLGDGAWAFGRKKSADVNVDITPAVSLVNARWGLTAAKRGVPQLVF